MNNFQEQMESDVFYSAIKTNGYFYDFDPQQKTFSLVNFFQTHYATSTGLDLIMST